MTFSGFPTGTKTFLKGLATHNDKAWFDAHRKDYDAYYVQSGCAFIQAMAGPLLALDEAVHAEPRINGSLMRINRDTRFSKDKRPYKDHLDIWFWTGARRGWDASGFFFRLTKDRLWAGAGMHAFPKEMLARYRQGVLDAKRGPELARVVSKLRKAGYTVADEHYKRVPQGVAADHPRADLLRHASLTATWQGPHPAQLGSAALVKVVAGHFKATAPLHRWLKELP